ncbi:MAG: hypothetical protein H6837_15545 [Planctomycetes bacterium]|nr:hypothetical protein [Planctomycetota bacterium]
MPGRAPAKPVGVLWHAALVVALCVAAFINALGNGFHIDDRARVADNPEIEAFYPPWRHFVDPTTSSTQANTRQYRPLLPLSLSINYAISGDSRVGFRIGNLLLQICASWVVYLLVRELLHRLAGARAGSTALLVAALFAVHPISGVPVNYICARDLLLMQVFLGASVWTYLRMRRIGETPLRWAVCLSCYLLSLLAKKNGIVLPALIGAVELLWFTGSWRRLWRVLPFGAVAAALMAFVRFGLGFSDLANVVHRTDSLTYFAHQLQHHVFYYLRNFVWPVPMRQMPQLDIETWRIAVGASVAAAAVGVAVWQRRRRPLLALCIVAYALMLSPTSSFLPMHPETTPYRPYPGSPWLFLGVAMALGAWPRVQRAVFGAAIALGLALSLYLNPIWSTEQTLYRHSVAYGGNAYAHCGLAASLPDGDEKRQLLERALELEPGYVDAHLHLGLMQIRVGDRATGLSRLRHAVALRPDSAEANYWLSVGLAKAGRAEEARQAAMESARLDPHSVRNRDAASRHAFELGMQAMRRKDYARAVTELEAALRVSLPGPNIATLQRALAVCRQRASRTGSTR